MAKPMVTVRRTIIITILLLAAGLRFHNLHAQSFWNDEGNSARLSERSIQLILEGTASDIHPPLYYLILRGWREMVGDSEFGLRSFSAMIGLVTVALSYALAARLASRKTSTFASSAPLMTSLLVALNPALIYYSQETRMYALLAFLSLLSTLILLRWLQAGPSGWRTISYILCAVAGLYTHYFFPATLLAHNLIVLGWLVNRSTNRHTGPQRAAATVRSTLLPSVIHWIGLMVATFLLYLPWFPIFLRQAQGRTAVRPNWLDFLQDSGYFMAFGPTITREAVYWPFMAALLLLVLGMVNSWRRTAVATGSLFVPLLFMYTVGATQPEFFKFLLVSIPFLATLLGFGWYWDNLKISWLRPLLFLPSAALLWGNLLAIGNLYGDPAYARSDYRAMVALIAAEAHPNAGVILSAPNQWEVFTYYHRQGAPVYPIPTGRPTPDRIETELQAIAKRHDRLYVLFWGELQQDPDGLVERWLNTHTFKARDEWVGNVRFITYAVPSEASDEMETIAGWRFGEQITLEGYTVAANRLAAGDIAQVTLFWQTDGAIERRYKVFLHLIDEQGQLLTQEDGEPGGGSQPTTGWQSQERIADNHGILVPLDSRPGEYTLLLGLYDLADPAKRLPITTPMGVLDATPLATIIIE